MAKSPSPKIVTKKHLARLERERIQNRNIVIIAAVILVIVLGVLGYGILDQTVLQARRPVARVGNDVITTQQFQTQVKYARFQLIQQYGNAKQLADFFGSDPNSAAYFQQNLQQLASQLTNTQTLGQDVLNQMIDDRFIKQEAQKRGITVTQEEVDKAIQAAFNYFPNGTPTPTVTPTIIPTPTLNPTSLALVTITPTPTTAPTETPTPEVTQTGAPTGVPTTSGTPGASTPTAAPTSSTPAGTGTPEPTATPYTLEGYQKQVQSFLTSVKTYGFTQDDLRSIFEYQLYREKLTAEITKDIKPEQDEVWARHILVADPAAAAAVEERLKKGEDFAKVAKEVSTDTSNKDSGGDLGWFPHGTMVKEFEDAAFSLKVGEISQPVKTTFGYHIIQVLGHEMRPLNGSDFTNYKNQQFQKWLTDQESKDTVTKYDRWQQVIPTEPTIPPDLLG